MVKKILRIFGLRIIREKEMYMYRKFSLPTTADMCDIIFTIAIKRFRNWNESADKIENVYLKRQLEKPAAVFV
jgi:hypothetical protein